jgi:hypothetical protein
MQKRVSAPGSGTLRAGHRAGARSASPFALAGKTSGWSSGRSVEGVQLNAFTIERPDSRRSLTALLGDVSQQRDRHPDVNEGQRREHDRLSDAHRYPGQNHVDGHCRDGQGQRKPFDQHN